MSAVFERVASNLSRLSSELKELGFDVKDLEEAISELKSIEGVLVTPPVATLVEGIANALSSIPQAVSREWVEELGRKVLGMVRELLPKCVKASSAIKAIVTVYSLSLITISVITTLFLAPSSTPNAVASLFTIFACSIAVFGVLVGMNIILLLLPALPIAPLAQCASLIPTDSYLAWVCLGIAVSIGGSATVTAISVRSYKRALVALLRIVSSVENALDRARSAREKVEEVGEEVKVEEIAELPREVYGEYAEELSRYINEVKRLK